MADTIFCSQCGTALDAQTRFCAKCGNAVAVTPVAAPPAYQPSAMSAAAAASSPPPPQAMATSAPAPPAVAPQYGAVPPGYAPQTAYTGVPPGAVSLPYAGFWMRVGAYLIDVLVLIVPIILLAFIPILGIILDIVGVWLYFALQESSERQATIGKRALNIYVTDLQGHRISFGQATGRHFSKILSGILCIGYIMVAFTEKKQGLHDMIASTLVKRR
jgi:uncharacterized RDD family membrane protein YckC